MQRWKKRVDEEGERIEYLRHHIPVSYTHLDVYKRQARNHQTIAVSRKRRRETSFTDGNGLKPKWFL